MLSEPFSSVCTWRVHFQVWRAN